MQPEMNDHDKAELARHLRAEYTRQLRHENELDAAYTIGWLCGCIATAIGVYVIMRLTRG